MLQKIKRILCFSLAMILLLLTFCSCKSKWDKEGKKAIGTCGEYEVLYEELRFVTLYYKDSFAATYGEDIWDDPETAEQYRAELEKTVWEMMLNNYAVLAACKKYHITKEDMESDAIQKAVDEDIAEAVADAGGEEAFQELLKSNYMTEHFMRFSLAVTQMEYELYYTLTDDLGVIMDDQETFLSWLEDGNCTYVQHLFIRNDPHDDVEANRQLAENARDRLEKSMDYKAELEMMIGNAQTNEDTAVMNPYFIVRDAYAKNITDEVLKLKRAGDVSNVVETEDGFYVFVRMPYKTDTLMLQLPSLLHTYQWAKVQEEVDACREGLSIELNEFGKSIDLLEIKPPEKD